MKELSIGTGVVTYSLNGACEVSFNPTDSVFIEKLFNAFDTLDKRQESYKDEVSKNADKRELFVIARKMDGEMREIINDVFDVDVCSALFGDMNVYALSDGLPVWAYLKQTTTAEIDTNFDREQKATNPRISKYTKKYQR